ncbi:MAG TPA: glutathione peroxidase [Gammaproteobacteria bacterium]
MENREGKAVPQVVFPVRQNHEWVSITSDDLFKGKRVAVFSLPGAFTPTCSSSHVPRFNELAPVFKENGIDDVICVSVNDTFVMNEWKQEQAADNITFIPDGNGQFTDGMGMLVDKDDLGFGKRSWRYSMIVNDGIIEKMFIEPDVPGDPYEVSDADTMLDYLNPNAVKPMDVFMFSKAGCPFCAKVKGILDDRGIAYEEIQLNQAQTIRAVRAVTGTDTVPQVFINGEYIGGSEAVEEYFSEAQAA